MNIREIVAANLVIYRRAAGLTQEEAAEKLGIDQSYVSRAENGKLLPREDRLNKFAEAYGMTDTLRFYDSERLGLAS